MSDTVTSGTDPQQMFDDQNGPLMSAHDHEGECGGVEIEIEVTVDVVVEVDCTVFETSRGHAMAQPHKQFSVARAFPLQRPISASQRNQTSKASRCLQQRTLVLRRSAMA